MVRFLRRTQTGWLYCVLVFSVVPAAPGHGQTFQQLTDLGSNIGPRLTRTDTRNRINRRLFGSMSSHVSYLDLTGTEGKAYEFASDAAWNRVLFGLKDDYIKQFKSFNATPGSFYGPGHLDISGGRTLYIADLLRQRVVVARFDPGSASMNFRQAIPMPGDLGGLAGLAWDGGSSPLSAEYFYATNGSDRVSYWYLPASGGATRQWTYGTFGSGVGQFDSAIAVCVGHAAGAGGSSVFTSQFYVVDAGNRRIVRLNRTSSGASWGKAVTLPDNGVPADCTVDHFGNVYVADSYNSRLIKYSWGLSELARYGSYGMGETNSHTFAHPAAVHVPFGKKTNASGQTVWYGEGRILTSEDWGDASGAREHWLGIAIPGASARVSDGFVWTSFGVTDHGYVTVSVLRVDGAADTPRLKDRVFSGPGSHSARWDGTLADGTPAPTGTYKFWISAQSAYGCSPAESWCFPGAHSPTFQWNQCVQKIDGGGTPSAPAGGAPPPNFAKWQPPPCSEANPRESAALDDLVVTGHLPVAFRIGQAIGAPVAPVLRVEGAQQARTAGAVLSDQAAIDIVRSSGIRALAVDVPSQGRSERVDIRIYSLTGRLVRRLHDETLEPGYYVLSWDGRDDRGNSVPPGVYVAYMNAGTFQGATRLIVK